MEHDHKNILLTCIYLACKVEESHVSAEELGKGIQQDPQVVLKNEMIVLQALEFELIVYPPYRSMEGFIYDLETFVQGMGSTGLKALQGSRVWFWNVTLIIYFCEFLVRGFGSLQLSEGQVWQQWINQVLGVVIF